MQTSNFYFSERSQNKLENVHPYLVTIAKRAIELSYVDFAITCGFRHKDEQYSLYKAGKSQLDGWNKRSYHNLNPSQAIDIAPYYGNKIEWHNNYLWGAIVNAFYLAEKELYQKSSIYRDKWSMRWGGDWANEGLLGSSNFMDAPHFEIRSKIKR